MSIDNIEVAFLNYTAKEINLSRYLLTIRSYIIDEFI